MSSLIEKNGHQSMLLRVNTEQWPSSQASFKKPKQLKDPVPDEMVEQDLDGNAGSNSANSQGDASHGRRLTDSEVPRRRLTGSDDISGDDVPRRRLTASEGSSDGWTALGFADAGIQSG